ncbi:MAG TPA: hypothetical protein VHJ77_01080 [Vicinamibacterales bacterium]|jgi:hypothetical protein|nr:hypothetical protein [Vicinamibacterales bacterium]
MQADVELGLWQRQWRAEPYDPSALKQRVERETRAMRRFVIGEIAVTIVFGGGSLAWAALSVRTDALVLALGVWAFIAMAWTISFLLRRGAWAPVTATTTAFLELSILRCRRRRESIGAQSVLYVLIVGFDLTWIYFARPSRAAHGIAAFLTSGEIAWVWGVTLALAVFAVWQKRRLGRELEMLTRLQRQIGGG